MPSYDESWQIYPSQVKGEFALFAVDLGAAEVAPIPTLSNLHWLRIVFRSDRPDGMPGEDEAAQLAEVEDWWLDRILEDDGAHVARMTCAGRRELFAYTKTDMINDIVAEGRRLFGERYDFEGNVRPDPSWEVYSEFLYPDEMARRRIQNFQIVTQLRHAGDVAEVTRPVDHHVYFPTQEARAQFVEEVVEAGFEVVSQPDEPQDDGDGNLPWPLHFKSFNTTDLATIDAIVLPLWIRAQELDANYDSWGTEVTKGE